MKKIEAIWLPEVQQQVFRALMEVISRPGKVENLATLTEQASPTRAVLATVLDAEVSFCDHDNLLEPDDSPLLQAENKSVEHANYILCRGDKSPNFEPMLGTLPSPEQSATLIIQVASVSDGDCQLTLSGPGVNGQQSICVSGLVSAWLIKREEWNATFPLGVDFILTDKQQVLALPRTTKIEMTSWDM